MIILLLHLLRLLPFLCGGHRQLALENLALRQQLAVYKRTMTGPKLQRSDRLFWVWLSRVWPAWRQALVIGAPATVLRWQRRRFLRHWATLSGRRPAGHPPVDAAIKALVRRMAAANPLWGAPRIHGELLKLGIDVAERTVSRLLPKRRSPPSQTWRTFLTNHVRDLVSIDFFTVPTARLRALFVFVVLAHDRRRVLHFNVTEHPTAAWTAQQIVDAFPDDSAPSYLLRDRDSVYGHVFRHRVKGDDQAVYGWRGGSADYLLRFAQLYPGGTVINLGENYRSTPEILAPAGRLIAHNERRLRKALTTQNPRGPVPEVRQFASDKEEAQYVADHIAEWVAEGLAPVAVLARMTTALVPIARACEQRGLTVRVTAETPLVERKVIRDLLAYLRVLVNPNDWSAFERVMSVPPRGIGAKTLAQLQQGVIRQGVEATLAVGARHHKGLAALLALLAMLRERMGGPAATLRTLIEALDYRAYLGPRGEPDETERRWSHVEELLELADGWEPRHGTDIRTFLDHLVLSEADDGGVTSHPVVGLTLHSAKGLQFDACVIAGVEEGLIPHYRHAGFDDLEEERRLFYVGLTRARTRLLLTVCRTRMLWGRPWAFGPSPFLAEARLV